MRACVCVCVDYYITIPITACVCTKKLLVKGAVQHYQ